MRRAIAYCRVSTEEQSRGLSLDSQRQTCSEEIARRGWQLVDVVSDHASGKSLRRPGWTSLGARLADGEADTLVVARLDRLSRSTLDFYDLLGRAEREGWEIVCLYPNVDMTDPMGRAMAGVAAIFAQLEREMIAMRQRESIAARKRAGTYRNNGPKMSPLARRRIAELHRENWTGVAIAQMLEAEHIPAPGGKRKWHRSTVYRAIAKLEELQGEREHDQPDDDQHDAHEHVAQP